MKLGPGDYDLDFDKVLGGVPDEDRPVITGRISVVISDPDWEEFEQICEELEISYEIEEPTVHTTIVRMELADYCLYSEEHRKRRYEAMGRYK